jgi:hypothetical protein
VLVETELGTMDADVYATDDVTNEDEFVIEETV